MFFSTYLLSGLALLSLYAVILVETAEPDNQIRFFCIQSSDRTFEEIAINDTDMLKKLDLKLDFAFFVHGWKSSFDVNKTDDTPYKIGLAWVEAKNINFCSVDWEGLASAGYYDAATKHVKTVGTKLAAFIAALKKLKGKVDFEIEIAGHSLGAHVAGYAGHLTQNGQNKMKISTIYALDPAAPFFTFSILLKGSDFRLSTNDANFVQVLHTTSVLGTSQNIGNADFIANGGNVQDACIDEVLKAQSLLFICSHSFAKILFLSSFTESCTGFVKAETDDGGFFSKIKSFFTKTKSIASDVYGIHSKKMKGVFELTTSNSEPYCKKT